MPIQFFEKNKGMFLFDFPNRKLLDSKKRHKDGRYIHFSISFFIKSALNLLAQDVYGTLTSYSLTVIPMFILMETFAFASGISRRLYKTTYIWVGQLRGGLSIATVFACAGFGAICGLSTATAATMGQIALPEMNKHKYDDALATGTVAAAGTLGILIPPSTVFIVYGILTEQSIGKLFGVMQIG